MRIVNPPAGAVYLRDPTLRTEYQTLPLRAMAESAARRLTWTVDGTRVGTASPDGSVHWPLAAGRHVVSVRDEEGREDQATIVVK